MLMQALYVIFCMALITTGLIFCIYAYPYMTNNIHEKTSAIKNVYYGKIPTWFHIKMKTNDAFTANNPIDIQINTTLIDLDQIRTFQVTLEGAEKDFSENEPTRPETPPFGASQELYNQYREAMDKYFEDYQKYREEEMNARFANIFFLNSDKDYNELVQREQEINSLRQSVNTSRENITLPKFSTFSGLLQNVTYSAGGKFDVGLTITKRDGGVIGYGMSDLSYVLKEAIEISPPEINLQIKNNNIITGLGIIAVGLVPLVVGLGGLLEILRRLAFP